MINCYNRLSSLVKAVVTLLWRSKRSFDFNDNLDCHIVSLNLHYFSGRILSCSSFYSISFILMYMSATTVLQGLKTQGKRGKKKMYLPITICDITLEACPWNSNVNSVQSCPECNLHSSRTSASGTKPFKDWERRTVLCHFCYGRFKTEALWVFEKSHSGRFRKQEEQRVTHKHCRWAYYVTKTILRNSQQRANVIELAFRIDWKIRLQMSHLQTIREETSQSVLNFPRICLN